MASRVSSVLAAGALSVTALIVQPLAADAGTARWTTHGPPGGTINALAIDPDDPSRMLAASGIGGIFRSTDGGATWRRAAGLPRDTQGFAISHAPSDPMVVYAALASGGMRSDDGGATWRHVYRETVVIDPSNRARVYAAGFDVLNGGAVLRSSARNSGWTVVSRSGLTTSWIASLAVSSNGRRLYAGTTGFGLDDGGGAFAWRYP